MLLVHMIYIWQNDTCFYRRATGPKIGEFLFRPDYRALPFLYGTTKGICRSALRHASCLAQLHMLEEIIRNINQFCLVAFLLFLYILIKLDVS